MKCKAFAVIMPFMFLAFNYVSGNLQTIYYNNLKFLKESDAPHSVTMIYTGHRSGQSTIVSDGILFTYKNRGARSVRISGNFIDWKPARMDRSDNGVWYYFMPAVERKHDVAYKYMVDGIWIMDPLNPERIDDRMGSYLSVVEPAVKSEDRHVTWRIFSGNTVEFRIYQPDASFVSIVGDFNHWNPENDLLSKGLDGIWRLRKKLFPGRYRYKYIIDGDWVPDTYNPLSGSDSTGEVCSVIEIKK
ncbi:MAG: hypothetical protein A2176_11435 [Spirochaetes bacterium RBG_13_51_14]|nr:MAG: hypothetical protein A2176_11435 [Spirochaetes bacterium RBG_13_51_14]